MEQNVGGLADQFPTILRQGSDDSADGVIELERLLEDLQRAVADGLPVLILATSIALSFLLERWPDGLQIRLPAGSRLMDTGGPKGRSVAIDRDRQHQGLAEVTGLSIDAMVGEFGMTELASQRYESVVRARLVGDIESSRLYFGPPWLRSVALDVETLAPLEETVVWVEMTLLQKKMYRAVLEARRDVLVSGLEHAPLPSLLNVQIELRKCCNHPFLIRGVEESVTRGMGDAEARDAMLSASGKLVLLAKLLPKLRSEGHRVLLFSQ